jgi:hypothetical protein
MCMYHKRIQNSRIISRDMCRSARKKLMLVSGIMKDRIDSVWRDLYDV